MNHIGHQVSMAGILGNATYLFYCHKCKTYYPTTNNNG